MYMDEENYNLHCYGILLYVWMIYALQLNPQAQLLTFSRPNTRLRSKGMDN